MELTCRRKPLNLAQARGARLELDSRQKADVELQGPDRRSEFDVRCWMSTFGPPVLGNILVKRLRRGRVVLVEGEGRQAPDSPSAGGRIETVRRAS
jgi:hypothetical protein